MTLRALLWLGLLLPVTSASAVPGLPPPDDGTVVIVPGTSTTFFPSTTTVPTSTTFFPTTTVKATTSTTFSPPTTTVTVTTSTTFLPTTTTVVPTTSTTFLPPTSTVTVTTSTTFLPTTTTVVPTTSTTFRPPTTTVPTTTSTFPSSTTTSSSTTSSTTTSSTTTTIPDCTCSDSAPVLHPCPGPVCGPMDVVFVVDTTGSMGGAICNVKVAIKALIDQIACVSGDDFQLGLVTFKDNVEVMDDLAPDNRDAVEEDVGGLFASGGNNGPEASDEALNTVVNGLDEADRAPGQQIGDFDGTFRAKAVKIVILITDAPPAGFDDQYTVGVDDVNAHARAVEAAAAGIKISAVFVPTAGDYMGQVAIMKDYAATTGGLYLETAPDGKGTAAAIDQIVLACGGSCGDEVIDPGEVCDDGNANDQDGCDQFCQESLLCPVLPPDSCVAGLESCLWPVEPDLTVPVCTWEVIGTGDGCDCGCGFADPDCAGAGCTTPGCTASACDACTDACGRWKACPKPGTCPAPPVYDPSSGPPISPPPGWICSPSWYGAGDYCDCACGAPDPDCLSTQTSGGIVCPAFCGNHQCDEEEFPSTCPEDCAPVPPFTEFPPSCGLGG